MLQGLVQNRHALRHASVLVLGVNTILIALHQFSGRMPVFNLDHEGNIPTWWSSLLLLGIGACASWAFVLERRKAQPLRWRSLWLGVAGLFLALSIDETASIHERLARTLLNGLNGPGILGQGVSSVWPISDLSALFGLDEGKRSFEWVFLFSPFVVAAFAFLGLFFWSRRRLLVGKGLLFGLGLAAYLGALILEPAGVIHTPDIAQWTAEQFALYQNLSLLEESLELLGSTLLLLTVFDFALSLARSLRAPSHAPTQTADVTTCRDADRIQQVERSH